MVGKVLSIMHIMRIISYHILSSTLIPKLYSHLTTKYKEKKTTKTEMKKKTREKDISRLVYSTSHPFIRGKKSVSGARDRSPMTQCCCFSGGRCGVWTWGLGPSGLEHGGEREGRRGRSRCYSRKGRISTPRSGKYLVRK